MSDDVRTLVSSLKTHLQENDGKLVWWGPPITDESSSTQQPSDDGDLTSKRDDLESLRTHTIGDCRRCALGATRNKLVFGVGNPEAPVVFVGEGPGFDEDRKGEPFVGKAGQLLDKILSAIQLDRTKVYIANIVKCHPMVNPETPQARGNDRAPAPSEIEPCLPFLLAQLSIIRPRIVVTLGAVATKVLLNRTEGISTLRGKLTSVNLDGVGPVRVLPTYHPAALLRDETYKKPVWEDMKLLRTILSQTAPDRLSSSSKPDGNSPSPFRALPSGEFPSGLQNDSAK